MLPVTMPRATALRWLSAAAFPPRYDNREEMQSLLLSPCLHCFLTLLVWVSPAHL